MPDQALIADLPRRLDLHAKWRRMEKGGERLVLIGADLCDANLRGADLCGANLCGEKLKSIPVFIYGLKWFVTVTNEFLTIGCQRHTHAEWEAFSDEQISDMAKGALNFWQMWKPSLLSVCAVQAAVK